MIKAFSHFVFSFVALYSLGGFISAYATTCAIRWDAWYESEAGWAGASTEATLSNPAFQFRAPLNYRQSATDGPYQLTKFFDRTVVTAEIKSVAQYAPNLCWAFLMYSPTKNVADTSSPYMTFFRAYINHPARNDVKWSMILQSSTLGTMADYKYASIAAVDYMKYPNYQKVLSNRPLVFIYVVKSDIDNIFGGSLANMAPAVDAIRKYALDQGLANPYIVAIDAGSRPTVSEAIRLAIKADAISLYSTATATQFAQPYLNYLGSPNNPSSLTVEGYWSLQCSATVAHCVPTGMTNWDTRPRKQRPPTFGVNVHPWFGNDVYVVQPTNAELSKQFSDAKSFIASSVNSIGMPGNPASLFLVYSWNEHDEGGSTLNLSHGEAPEKSRLSAIGKNLP